MEVGSLASGFQHSLDQSHFYRTRVGCGLEGVWYDESKLRQFNPGGGDRSPVSKCLHKISLVASMLGRGLSRQTPAGTIRTGCVEEPGGS